MRKLAIIKGTMAIMLSCVLLSSCNDDELFDMDQTVNTCDNICFGVSYGDYQKSRGNINDGVNEYTSDKFVLRSEETSDTLCVTTVISDGINNSDRNSNTAITRGAPITGEYFNEFKVLSYWKKNGDVVNNNFFMSEVVTKGDGEIWNTAKKYYWPGSDYSLQFFAWAPVEASITPPANQTVKTFTYTVPDDAAKQTDLLVSFSEEVSGNYNANLNMTFKHVCTAVKFVVGDQMQSGDIKSVSLIGVRYNGTYDISTSGWTLENDTKTFTQKLNKDMTGGEGEGTAITSSEGTFMMLPQTLPDGAKIQVEFQDDITGELRTLEASIAGTEWPQGKTVAYKLSITPDYDMSITCERDIVDAHVDIEEITIKADGPWVLSSDVDWLTFTDWSYDTSKPEERPLGRRGYWIRSERGNKTFSGSGNMTLYAYYDENLGNESRTANITLTYPGTSIAGAQKTVTQYCPAWSSNAGYERFEEDHRWEEDGSKTFTYPFGFAWDRKVEFSAQPKVDIFNFSFRDLLGAYVFLYIANNAIENYGAGDYVTVKKETAWWSLGLTAKTTVTIDYSKFNAIGDLVSSDDGLTNTRNLYEFQNIGQVSAIENVLRDNAVGSFNEKVINDSHQNIPVDQFAARRIAMKNEFQKVLREETVQGETIRYYEAVIDVNAIHWYLPASNEQVSLKAGLTEGDEPLEGEYWSSTALSDNTNAYKYNPDGILNSEDRMVPHKMRAAVRKPQ